MRTPPTLAARPKGRHVPTRGCRALIDRSASRQQRRGRNQGKFLTKLKKWFTHLEILKMSTSKPGELLTLSGSRNPYLGDLGVVKERADADLLVVEGNPLNDLEAVTDSDDAKIIVTDGKIFKNTVN